MRAASGGGSRAATVVLVVLLAVAASGSAASRPSAALPSGGLVGRWPLDGNATDTSGTGRDGTAVVATPATRGHRRLAANDFAPCSTS
jgi:hypothetical protein